VRQDRVTHHRAVDIAVLVCVVGLAVATWAAISDTGRTSTWRPCFTISATIFLALAAATPHATWAAAMRLAMSGWLMMAPWLLAFADLPLARWSHVIAGSLIAALSAPRLLRSPALLTNQDAGCT